MKYGWISLHRKLQKNWVWEDKPFSKGQAWIDILLDCNHSENKVLIKNQLLNVKRGESVNSLKTWAQKWGWNVGRVRRFLSLLQKDSMVVVKNDTVTTRLIVCNYITYQEFQHDNESQVNRKRIASESQVNTNNKDNKENNDNKKKIEPKMTKDMFELFWTKYPNKKDKKKAHDKFLKLNPELFDTIMINLDYQIQSIGWKNENGKYVPIPTKWINGERWNDVIEEKKGNDVDFTPKRTVHY